MRIGIIGFGLIGQQRARDIFRIKNQKIVAVCDKRLDVLKKKQGEFGYEIESDWRNLIKRHDLDFVIVAVPHYLAAEISIAALKQNKHVMCEKPISITFNDAKKIARAVKESGKQFEPGFNFRFYPGILKIKKLIDENAIGKITHARMVYGHGGRRGMENEWKLKRKFAGGGALLDPGIHEIDLIRFLFGEIVSGEAFFRNSYWRGVDVEDNAFFTFLTNKKILISGHSSITEWKNLMRIEVFGTDGYIKLEGRSKSYGPQTVVMGKRWFFEKNTKEKKWQFSDAENSFYCELKAFLQKIEKKGRSSGIAGLNDGLRAVEVIEKLYKTIAKKQVFLL